MRRDVAKDKEREIVIATKCVIIATGGYGGNKQLIRKYYPNYTEVMKCHGLCPIIGTSSINNTGRK